MSLRSPHRRRCGHPGEMSIANAFTPRGVTMSRRVSGMSAAGRGVAVSRTTRAATATTSVTAQPAHAQRGIVLEHVLAWRRVERPREREPHVADVVEPLARVLLQAAVQAQPDRVRRTGRQRVPVGLRLDHVGEHFGHVVALEGRLAGDHLVEHAAERPDVGALVDARVRAPAPGSCRRRCRAARRRGCLAQSSSESARDLRLPIHRPLDGPREPEVEHLHARRRA